MLGVRHTGVRSALRSSTHLLQLFLRRRSLFVPVIVIVITGAATNLGSLIAYQ